MYKLFVTPNVSHETLFPKFHNLFIQRYSELLYDLEDVEYGVCYVSHLHDLSSH